MNASLRRVATVVLVMVLALMVSTTWIQYFRADQLNADPRNVRTIYREFGSARGPIVVAGAAVASSAPVNDAFGYQRSYSDGPLYAHLTGFFSIANGANEIEAAKNDLLNGSSDQLWLQRISTLVRGQAPQGASVELTIDPAVQKAAWDALGNQRGAVVALEPATGKVLALVSKPSYDPNALTGHSTSQAAKAYQELLAADGNPLANRAIRGNTYPPGSTFKLVTAAAAIESGAYTSESEVPAPQAYQLPLSTSVLHNFGGIRCSPTGRQSLADALRISCNTAFADLGVNLGADALRAQAEAFGFDAPLAIPMGVTRSAFPAKPDAPQTALAAIGQGDVRVTPMQIAMISAAIANGGVQMVPYTVTAVRGPNLEVIEEARPHRARTAISPATAEQLTQMMLGVVTNGTGTSAQIRGVQVAGKTGTAENAPGAAPHAWFTGFAPADNPQVAVAVIVERGGSLGSEATGGAVAAPIARAVMEAVINR